MSRLKRAGEKEIDELDHREVLKVVNPAGGEMLASISSATEEDVKKAVAAAVEGQTKWAKRNAKDRIELLRKFANMVRERRLELGEIFSRESGKPYREEAMWEIDMIPRAFERFCDIVEDYSDKTLSLKSESGYDGDIQLTIHEPLGVIGCVIPFYFPLVIWAYEVSAALAAGNAVVVRAPSYNPIAVLELHKMFAQAGVPASVVQVLTGSDSQINVWLCRNRGISSFRDVQKDLYLAKTTGNSWIPHKLIPGGMGPFIVFEDADINQAVKAAGNQCRIDCRCGVGPRCFLIHSSRENEFVNRLISEYLDEEIIGDPMNPDVTMGPMNSEQLAIRVEERVNRAVSQGAEIKYGGKRYGAFYSPTILTNVTKKMDIAKCREMLGPVWLIIKFNTAEEAIEIGNSLSYGRDGELFSQNMQTCLRAARALKAESVTVNGTGNFCIPGMPLQDKDLESSNIKENLLAVMKEVTQTKSIVLRYVLN